MRLPLVNQMTTKSKLQANTLDLYTGRLVRNRNITHVRIAIILFILLLTTYSMLNVYVWHQLKALGTLQLGIVGVCLIPALILTYRTNALWHATVLTMVAALACVVTLLVQGGADGVALFWVYALPFLAFFICGRTVAWVFSGALVAIVAAFWLWIQPTFGYGYSFSSDVKGTFFVTLCFYTMVAATMTRLHGGFQRQLRELVKETATKGEEVLGTLDFLATHDKLTGLPNKISLLSKLSASLVQASVSDHQVVLCVIRIERLVELENVVGSSSFDAVMMAIVSDLQSRCSEDVVLARTRRDEFMMAFVERGEGKVPAALQQLINERHLSISQQQYELLIELTIGIASFPLDATDADLLITRAEQAMLSASRRRLQLAFFDPEEEQKFRSHQLMFGKLREALRLQQLSVHYQPQIAMATGQIVGAEALMRWRDSSGKMIPPNEFITVAEESGLIFTLTEWLIQTVTQDCTNWWGDGIKVGVSINLSPRCLLAPDLISQLAEALGTAKFSPQHLTIEITENCVLGAPEQSIDVLNQIKRLGIKVSIDDFGTGYSSLAYMKNMPLDELKIDQVFIRNLLSSPDDQAIVSSTLDLAHNFGLSVVAEGIEDESTLNWLRAKGCDVGQGYAVGRPMPLNDFLRIAAAAAPQLQG